MVRRVVITGMGAVTPLANDLPGYWDSLLAGKSGMGPITSFDASAFACRFAAEVKGFNPLDWIEKKEVKKMGRFIHFAIGASQFAMSNRDLWCIMQHCQITLTKICITCRTWPDQLLQPQAKCHCRSSIDRRLIIKTFIQLHHHARQLLQPGKMRMIRDQT